MFIRIGKQIWREAIYALTLLVYLFNLQQLNKELVAQNLSSVEIVNGLFIAQTSHRPLISKWN